MFLLNKYLGHQRLVRVYPNQFRVGPDAGRLFLKKKHYSLFENSVSRLLLSMLCARQKIVIVFLRNYVKIIVPNVKKRCNNGKTKEEAT